MKHAVFSAGLTKMQDVEMTDQIARHGTTGHHKHIHRNSQFIYTDY